MLARKEKRVTVSKDIDLEPYTVLRKGEKGTVLYSEEDGDGMVTADILMDREHQGLAMWGNTAHIAGPELARLSFTERPRKVSISYSAMVAGVVGFLVMGMVAAEAVEAYEGHAVAVQLWDDLNL